MGSLEGRHGLVSGAASGIGPALVQALADHGVALIVTDTSDEIVEDMVGGLTLSDPDAVLPRAMESTDVAGWWDLANLVAAFFHTLDLFVFIAPAGPDAAESLESAIARLRASLTEAAKQSGRCARVIALAGDDTVGATTAEALGRGVAELASQLEADGEGVWLGAIAPGDANADEVAAAIVELAGDESLDSNGRVWHLAGARPIPTPEPSAPAGDPHAA